MVFEALLARVRRVGASMSGLELLGVGVGAGEALMPAMNEDVARFVCMYAWGTDVESDVDYTPTPALRTPSAGCGRNPWRSFL